MRFDRFDDFPVERNLLGGSAEGAVIHVPPGAAGDLSNFGSGQPPRAAPVEFADPGEGDMVEIHVETHADRVSRDEIVNLAGLEHPDLRVARPRAQRAENYRSAAPLPADQLGKREHVRNGEGDDRATRRQPRHLFVAGIGQDREAWPAHILDLGDQPAHQRLYRGGTKEHCFLHPSGVQEPRGKDMAALGIGAQLALVHRQEVDLPIERHRFDSANKIGRVRR